MKLRTINTVLRKFGLVLVICVGKDEPTLLWIERFSTYTARTGQRLSAR